MQWDYYYVSASLGTDFFFESVHIRFVLLSDSSLNHCDKLIYADEHCKMSCELKTVYNLGDIMVQRSEHWY